MKLRFCITYDLVVATLPKVCDLGGSVGSAHLPLHCTQGTNIETLNRQSLPPTRCWRAMVREVCASSACPLVTPS